MSKARSRGERARGRAPYPPGLAFHLLAGLLRRLADADPDLAALEARLHGTSLAFLGVLRGGETLIVHWEEAGPQLRRGEKAEADLTLSGPPGAFLDLLLRGSSRRLTMSGRIDLAHALASYLRALRASRRELLALVVGDLPLGLAERGISELRALCTRRLRDRRGLAKVLVDRSTWEEFAHEVADLQQRVHTLVRDPRIAP